MAAIAPSVALDADTRVPDSAVDVVVPVYNAAGDVRRCVESVLAHTTGAYRLVLIDDASPDPDIAELFAEIAARRLPQVELLRNEHNLGFTGTANRGMRLSRCDVVLLNSDTMVTRGWLDALRRCAAANPSFGTITPFSNNAEICSFPHFCHDNPWPMEADPEPVRAALAAAAVPTYPDLPTGVGFCMYVRRTLIDAIGVFDSAFGLGYGEENDFCLRGFAVGYRNVLCDDAFVLHLGGRSFEGQKAELGRRNLALLLARHPHYDAMVHQFIAADPLRPLREAALSHLRSHRDGRTGVLHVIHGHGGGTEHHVRALIDASRGDFRHYLVTALGDRWQLEEHLDDAAVRTFDFRREPAESWGAFMEALCGTFNIALVHLHNISGCREGILSALENASVPYGYTVHDVNFACPTITFLDASGTYCGGQTDARQCSACLAAQPEFAGIAIESWRSRHARLLARAAFVIAPSQWAAAQLQRYFDVPRIDVIPHGAPGIWALRDSTNVTAPPSPRRLVVLLPRDDIPTVAVLGAIGPDKGARRLERMVALAREANARVRFVLIGYLDREHGPWQSDDARFTINGRYRPEDLPELLEHYRVKLVMYPSAGPETFSFTLSESWAAGRPVLVPPIGALAERVADSGAGWVWTNTEWASEERMLNVLLERLSPAAEPALAHAAAQALRMPHVAPRTMAERTAEVYARVLSGKAAQAPVRCLEPVRVRDALGYQLWYPPILERIAAPDTCIGSTAEVSMPLTQGSVLARCARRLRQTRLGKMLRALAPVPVREALRARLRP